ncbi:MAG: winged helix-turn-helix domain-containing protein [Methylobacteriaceae bacterium]|nr:winged helix-turn-helix domain-containing protein [Methylobacteriaceae bacterium]
MSAPAPFARLRLVLSPGNLIGPGKADLLQGVAETGSIAAAGRRMNMSYKRAWRLVDTMNACFGRPLVASAKGGRDGGGAQLTDLGREVLDLYRRMQANADAAIAADLARLARLAGQDPAPID